MYNHIFTLNFDDLTSVVGLLIGKKVIVTLVDSYTNVRYSQTASILELVETFETLTISHESLENVALYNMQLIPDNLLNQLTALQK